MKRLFTTAVILLGCVTAAAAGTAPIKTESLAQGSYGTPVDSFRAVLRLDNWRALDRDSLIVWATPGRPYLLELNRPSPDLRFVQAIALSASTFRVRAGLDSVIVRGIDYPILAIYALDAEDARALTGGTST